MRQFQLRISTASHHARCLLRARGTLLEIDSLGPGSEIGLIVCAADLRRFRLRFLGHSLSLVSRVWRAAAYLCQQADKESPRGQNHKNSEADFESTLRQDMGETDSERREETGNRRNHHNTDQGYEA